jgi:hypothetical protein
MSKHVTISPNEAADRLAIRESRRSLRILRRSPRYERPDVSIYSRYALRRVHEHQGSEAFAGAALARGARYMSVCYFPGTRLSVDGLERSRLLCWFGGTFTTVTYNFGF